MYIMNLNLNLFSLITNYKIYSQECGQNVFLRNKARILWDKVGGEKIVFSHISSHITKNSVTNPHYAPPKTNLPLSDEIKEEEDYS